MDVGVYGEIVITSDPPHTATAAFPGRGMSEATSTVIATVASSRGGK